MNAKNNGKPGKVKITDLSEEKLDAIATHGGLFGSVLDLVTEDDYMYCLREEVQRLQDVAIDELERRNLLLSTQANLRDMLT